MLKLVKPKLYTKKLIIRITDTDMEKLNLLAKTSGLTKSALGRLAVQKLIEEQIEQQDATPLAS